MWLYLCSHWSPPVVRVYGVDTGSVRLTKMYYGDTYPTTAAILDQNNVVQTGIHPENYYPACFQRPTTTDDIATLAAHDSIHTATKMPDCPTNFLASAPLMWTRLPTPDQQVPQQDNIKSWELRGGIVAGMSVFSYLQSGGAQHTVTPYYNQCEMLK